MKQYILKRQDISYEHYSPCLILHTHQHTPTKTTFMAAINVDIKIRQQKARIDKVSQPRCHIIKTKYMIDGFY